MEAATATKTRPARFVSKGRNLRLVLLTPMDGPHPVSGAKMEIQRGFTAEFARQPFLPEIHETDGSFEWPGDETNLGEIGESGHRTYVDPISHAEVDIVKAMREHEFFNIQFFEQGPTAQELLEDQRRVLGEITRAIRSGDAERLAAIYDDEEHGQKREPILTAALEGLKALEEPVA